jgi:predicted DNA-binding transcriptional regulator AlpA
MPAPPATASRLINAHQLAGLLKCSKTTLWRMVRTGQVPPTIRVRGLHRWDAEVISRWIDAGCPPPK